MSVYQLGPGTIEYVKLTNFLGWRSKQFDFNHPIPLIYGSNGSGKSSVFQAISFCLGEDAKNLRDDATDETLFIHRGESESVVTLALRNVSVENNGTGRYISAFRPDVFGDTIYVQRTITRSGFSRPVVGMLKSSGKVVPPSVSKYPSNPIQPRILREVVFQHFEIFPKNPLFVLNQQLMKVLAGSDPKDLFDFVSKGYNLNEMAHNLIDAMTTVQRIYPKIIDLQKISTKYLEEYTRLQKLEKSARLIETSKTKISEHEKAIKISSLSISEIHLEESRKHLSSLKDSLTQIRANIDELHESLRLSKTCVKEKESKIEEVKKMIEEVGQQVSEMENTKSSIESQIDSIRREMSQYSEKLSSLQSSKTLNDSKIKSLNRSLEAHLAERNMRRVSQPLEPDMSKFDSILTLEDQLEKAKIKLNDLNQEFQAKKISERIAKMNSEKKDLNNRVSSLNMQLKTLSEGKKLCHAKQIFNLVFPKGCPVNHIPVENASVEGYEEIGTYAPLGSWVSLKSNSTSSPYIQSVYGYFQKHTKVILTNQNIPPRQDITTAQFKSAKDFTFNRSLVSSTMERARSQIEFLDPVSILDLISINSGVVETYLFANQITNVFFAKSSVIAANEERLKSVRNRLLIFDEECNSHSINNGSYIYNVSKSSEFMRMGRNITSYTSVIDHTSIDEIEQTKKDVLQAINSIDMEIKALSIENVNAMDTINKKVQEIDDYNRNIISLNNEKTRVRLRYQKALEAYEIALNELNNDDQINEMSAQISLLELRNTDLDSQIEKEKSDLEVLSNQINEQIKEKTSEITTISSQVSDLTLKKDELIKEINSLSSELRRMKNVEQIELNIASQTEALRFSEISINTFEGKLTSDENSFAQMKQDFETFYGSNEYSLISSPVIELENQISSAEESIRSLNKSIENVDLEGFDSIEDILVSKSKFTKKSKQAMDQLSQSAFNFLRSFIMAKTNFMELNLRVQLIKGSVDSEFAMKTKATINKELHFTFIPSSNLHSNSKLFESVDQSIIDTVKSINSSLLDSDGNASIPKEHLRNFLNAIEQVFDNFNTFELSWSSGKLLFEHEGKHIDLSSLSGGEKSTSIVALLTSLWTYSNAPFVAIDEFDVFMDDLKKSKNFEYLANSALMRQRQAVFVTPNPVKLDGMKLKIPCFKTDVNGGKIPSESSIDAHEVVNEIFLPPKGTVVQ